MNSILLEDLKAGIAEINRFGNDPARFVPTSPESIAALAVACEKYQAMEAARDFRLRSGENRSAVLDDFNRDVREAFFQPIWPNQQSR